MARDVLLQRRLAGGPFVVCTHCHPYHATAPAARLMDIRPATPDDVPAVLPMVAKVCAFHEALDPAKYGFREAPARMYDKWLVARSTDPRSVFLVADAGAGHLVGFLVGTVEPELSIYRLKEYGFIHDLWVEEKYRNEGTARQMVTLAVERFRDIGVKQVRLDTAWANEPARGLFAACGFRPSVVEMLLETGTEARGHEGTQG